MVVHVSVDVAAPRLKVCRCIGASSRTVVLVLVRGRCRAVLGLVTEGSSSAGHEVIVVFLDTCLALLHAPEDESNAAKQQSTSDASDDTTDDLLVGVAEATIAVACLLFGRSFSEGDLSSSSDRGAGAGRGLGDLLVAAHGDDGGGELAQGGGQQIRGPCDGRSPDRRRGRGSP